MNMSRGFKEKVLAKYPKARCVMSGDGVSKYYKVILSSEIGHAAKGDSARTAWRLAYVWSLRRERLGLDCASRRGEERG